MKKRFTYGTVMIDIDTKRIIDILSSRDSDDVIEWLKTYPNLEIISRDGSLTYAAAIRRAHPNAIQVSDRFHLLKNLTDYCKSYITKILNFKVKIKTSEVDTIDAPTEQSFSKRDARIKKTKELSLKGLSLSEISSQLKMDIRTVKKYININVNDMSKTNMQTKHEDSISKKQKNIDLVRDFKNKGYGIRQISRETGLARSTVRRYLDLNTTAVHASYGTKRECKLAKYHSTIDELTAKGYAFKNIEEYIRNKGYKGSSSGIRMYTTRKRKLLKEVTTADVCKHIIVERKDIIKLLYRPLENIKSLSEDLLEKVYAEHPILLQIHKLNNEFKEVIFSNDANRLSSWIESDKKLDISDINSFINGITNDIEAVKNAITYEYSNGLAEGNVNKIKVIKRIMYGRCSFDTLRRKVLQLEKFRSIN